MARGAALYDLGRFSESSVSLILAKRHRAADEVQISLKLINLMLWTNYSQDGKFGLAFAVAEEMFKNSPKTSEGRAFRSRSLAQMGRLDEALKEADEAVLLDSKSSIAWLAKAIVREQKGDYQQAMEAYDWVLKRKDWTQDFFVRCAFLLATCPVDKYRNGKGALHVANGTFSSIKLPEHQRTAQIVMAIALAECGDYKKASATLRGAMEIGNPPADLRRRCKMLEALFEKGQPYRHDAARPQDHIFSIPAGTLILTPQALIAPKTTDIKKP